MTREAAIPGSASGRALTPSGQGVTFVELFFDLVFVFAITQVVGVLHHEMTPIGVSQALLVFWLVWWAWSQYTWALNAADTTKRVVQLGTLLATATAFFMAVAVPDAFHGHPLAFAIPYVLVRLIGLSLYLWVTANRDGHWRGVRVFALLSLGGLAAVLAGAVLGGQSLYGLWAVTIVLDLIAAILSLKQGPWHLDAGHFAERHGLIVIIALGESLIVSANSLTGADAWDPQTSFVALAAVSLICGLWWTYFARSNDVIEHHFASLVGEKAAQFARNAYTLSHFVLVFGVILLSASLEEALAHPVTPLSGLVLGLLGSGVTLFLGVVGLSLWWAGHRPYLRLALALITGLCVVGFSGVNAGVSLGCAAVGVLLVAAFERLPTPDH